MIDFRYHLVSIVAIFLALATGIVLGTTLLQEPALESAKQVTDTLTAEKQELRTQLDALNRREKGNDAFVTSMTPQLVSGDLTGQRLLLVDMPGATASLRELQEQVLLQAGASIVGRISLSERFLDSNDNLLNESATTLQPTGVAFPPDATPYDKAGIVLGNALMTKEDATETLGGLALTAFESGGLISVDDEITARATLAVVFAPETPFQGETAETQAAGVVALTDGLDAYGRGALIASTVTSTATGGVLGALRDDGDASKRVSSIDTLNMPAGRVVVVYALQEQVAGGAGQYGIGTGASAFQPAVPAIPTPTPTLSGS
ncbi:copper transporter [Nonomuraea sp. NPDC050663]|uniref:copper transporter n=1 Tax=Nonomuraea sp. NPDC050663 TaxID=3364370 RepID=UPI0037B19827